MYSKIILFVLFAATYTRAQNNQICPCDTEQDIKDNKDYWQLLKAISGDVTDDLKELYSVSPGSLYQFDCSHCDEKLRKKRKIEDPPEEPETDVKDVKDVPETPKDVKEESEKKVEEGEKDVKEESKDKKEKVNDGAEKSNPDKVETDPDNWTISRDNVRCAQGYVLMYRFCVPRVQVDDVGGIDYE